MVRLRGCTPGGGVEVVGAPSCPHTSPVLACRVEDSKILHGPFVPSGKEKIGDHATRQSLPAILKELHACLDEDWGDYRFSVMSTEDDAVVVRFELESVDSERGLHAYMNVMARSGGAWIRVQRCVRAWGLVVLQRRHRPRIVPLCPRRGRRGDEVQAAEGGRGLAQSAWRRVLVLHVPTTVGAGAGNGHLLHAAPRGAQLQHVTGGDAGLGADGHEGQVARHEPDAGRQRRRVAEPQPLACWLQVADTPAVMLATGTLINMLFDMHTTRYDVNSTHIRARSRGHASMLSALSMAMAPP